MRKPSRCEFIRKTSGGVGQISRRPDPGSAPAAADRRAWAGMTHGCTMIIKGRRYTPGAAGIARSNSVELLERDFDRDLQQL
jgi:hypothetical protein